MSRPLLRPDLSALRGSRDFRAVFASRVVAMLGSQAAEVALLVQARRLTGSPLIVGLLGMAELAPLVVFGLYGGVLADRFDRRALMRWCEPGLACCAGLLLLNALLPRPAVWPLYAVSAVMMALASLQRPAFEAATPRIVPREQITAAAALLSMFQNVSVLAGSSLGGVLAVTPGPWLVYALDAAGFAVSFAALGRLPSLPPAERGAGGQGPALREILAGLRYAAGRKDLLGSYLADLSAMIFAYPNALFPFMAVTLHAPWATGLMFAAPSAGAFAVSATSGWMGRVRRHGLAIAVAAALWGAAMAGFGLSPDIYVALGFLAVAGGADETSGIFRDTLWMQTIPDHLRGRMAGIELLSYAAGPPAGQLRSGVVASLAGFRFSLVCGGIACVAAVGAVCVALPAFSGYVAAAPRAGRPPALPDARAIHDPERFLAYSEFSLHREGFFGRGRGGRPSGRGGAEDGRGGGRRTGRRKTGGAEGLPAEAGEAAEQKKKAGPHGPAFLLACVGVGGVGWGRAAPRAGGGPRGCVPAVSCSPAGFPPQYHRRWRA